MLKRGELSNYTQTVQVYYADSDQPRLQEVKDLATLREPVNIAMSQLYNKAELKTAFDYTDGAYGRSTQEKLMPNLAIYCKTPLRRSAERDGPPYVTVHVVNAIGMGFDDPRQKDYQYFLGGAGLTPPKWQELVSRMSCTWTFIFDCARRHNLSRIYNTRVGGGHFAEYLNRHPQYDYNRLHLESLEPVKARYSGIEVKDLGEIFRDPDKVFQPGMRQILEESLLVNAWDPWSMVGNGNAMDDSLDGKFGRISAMAVLCWPQTNPDLQYVPVSV